MNEQVQKTADSQHGGSERAERQGASAGDRRPEAAALLGCRRAAALVEGLVGVHGSSPREIDFPHTSNTSHMRNGKARNSPSCSCSCGFAPAYCT